MRKIANHTYNTRRRVDSHSADEEEEGCMYAKEVGEGVVAEVVEGMGPFPGRRSKKGAEVLR